MLSPTIILINDIYDFCVRREYAFNILLKYNIITYFLLLRTFVSDFPYMADDSTIYIIIIYIYSY